MIPTYEVANDVAAGHNILVSRLQSCLKRLSIYSGIPLVADMTTMFRKTMTEVLCIIAVWRKEITQRKICDVKLSDALFSVRSFAET
jgi:hypothetical protein